MRTRIGRFEAWALPLVAAVLVPTARLQAEEFPVRITVDLAATRGELRPIWRFFGADEPNYAYMKDGRTLLCQLGRLGPEQVYFRAH